MAKDFIAPDFDGDDLRIGLVQSRFNEWAGRALAESCMNELITLGVDEDDITHLTVPGSLEIPLALAKLAATDDFANAILTTDTDEQARARVAEKGRDAARTAVEMANLLWALDENGTSAATSEE